MSDSLRPDGLQPTRLLPIKLLCPWDYPSKNTGVGCHFLPQGIFPTQGSNPLLLPCRRILYCLSRQGSPRSLKLRWPLARGPRASSQKCVHPEPNPTLTTSSFIWEGAAPKEPTRQERRLSHSRLEAEPLGPRRVLHHCAPRPRGCIQGWRLLT